MNTSVQRHLLLGLWGIWCVLLVVRVMSPEDRQEVPLQFVSGRPAAKIPTGTGVPDPWQMTRVTIQAREMPEGPKKNIFAPLDESTVVGTTTVVAKRAERTTPAPPLPVLVVAPPLAVSGPTPLELAEQAARQQEALALKQVRDQMGQYRYLGYLSQQGVQKAFVGKGRDIYIIRKGDKLDGKFLVAAIDPATVKLREPTTSIEASLDLKKEGDLGPS